MPACSGAPGVMGIHNTHTHIYTHPATHTHSLQAPELTSRWHLHVSTATGAAGLQKTSVTLMMVVMLGVCVSVWTALRSEGDSLPEWGFGDAARWRCHFSLNLVLPAYTGGLWTRCYFKEGTFLSLGTFGYVLFFCSCVNFPIIPPSWKYLLHWVFQMCDFNMMHSVLE